MVSVMSDKKEPEEIIMTEDEFWAAFRAVHLARLPLNSMLWPRLLTAPNNNWRRSPKRESNVFSKRVGIGTKIQLMKSEPAASRMSGAKLNRWNWLWNDAKTKTKKPGSLTQPTAGRPRSAHLFDCGGNSRPRRKKQSALGALGNRSIIELRWHPHFLRLQSRLSSIWRSSRPTVTATN